MLTDQTDRHRAVHRAIHFLAITQRDDQELMAILPYAALFLGGAKSESWVAMLPAWTPAARQARVGEGRGNALRPSQ